MPTDQIRSIQDEVRRIHRDLVDVTKRAIEARASAEIDRGLQEARDAVWRVNELLYDEVPE
jgi:hypothetical protein